MTAGKLKETRAVSLRSGLCGWPTLAVSVPKIMGQRFDACGFHVRVRRQIEARIELRAGGSSLGRANEDVVNERIGAVGGYIGVFLEIPVRVEEAVRVFSCFRADRDEMLDWFSCCIGIAGALVEIKVALKQIRARDQLNIAVVDSGGRGRGFAPRLAAGDLPCPSHS